MERTPPSHLAAAARRREEGVVGQLPSWLDALRVRDEELVERALEQLVRARAAERREAQPLRRGYRCPPPDERDWPPGGGRRLEALVL